MIYREGFWYTSSPQPGRPLLHRMSCEMAVSRQALLLCFLFRRCVVVLPHPQFVAQMPWSTHRGLGVSSSAVSGAPPRWHTHAWQPLREVKCKNGAPPATQDTSLAALKFTSRTCNLSIPIALMLWENPQAPAACPKIHRENLECRIFFPCCLRAVLITGAQPNPRN